MFYIQPKSEHAAAKWLQIANLDRLPVHNPQPHKGLWHVNAAALNPWSLRSIAAHLARRSKSHRQTWLQAFEQVMTQIGDGFTVQAEEWELVEAPETHISGAFVWPSPTHALTVHVDSEPRHTPGKAERNYLLPAHYIYSYS